MELDKINAQLRVTDELTQSINSLLEQHSDSIAYTTVLTKVLDFVDELNWDLVLAGEKILNTQAEEIRQLNAHWD